MTPLRPDSNRPGNDNAVPEEALQAYVDGQLEGRRRAAIEAYLAGHPDDAARLAAYRRQNIGLHALFDSTPKDAADREAIPPRITALAAELDARLCTRAAQPRRRPLLLRRLAASVALLATAGTAGWLTLDAVGGRSDALVNLTRQAAEAPLQPMAATPASTAATEDRQVVAWLAAQPGEVPATVPDLEALGFRLSGERLVTTADGGPAAQLLYSDAAGQRVTLTMRSGGKSGQTSFTFARDGAATRFFWQDAHMAYSLSGSMAQEKLLQIAEAISTGLAATAEVPTVEENAPATAIQQGSAAPGADAAAPGLKSVPLLPVPADADDLPEET